MAYKSDIDELISKFLSGEAGPEEAIRLEDWKEESLVNAAYFDKCLILFNTSNLNQQKNIRSQGWAMVNAQINLYDRSIRTKLFKRKIGFAAAILSIAVITLVLFLVYPDPKVYHAGSDPINIVLADSSIISLAPNSNLTVDKDFGKANRHVSLIGSAWFSVKHDRNKPFIVKANSVYVEDIGTKFTIVTSTNADTNVILVHEGEVIVYDNIGSSANILQDERAQYVSSANELKVFRIPEAEDSNVISDSIPARQIQKNIPKKFYDTIKPIPPVKTDSKVVAPIPPIHYKSVPLEPVLPKNK